MRIKKILGKNVGVAILILIGMIIVGAAS